MVRINSPVTTPASVPCSSILAYPACFIEDTCSFAGLIPLKFASGENNDCIPNCDKMVFKLTSDDTTNLRTNYKQESSDYHKIYT